MSSTMMMERTGVGMPAMAGPGMGTQPTPVGNMVMVPRCTFKFEKCTGGMKVTCVCADAMASSMTQNLCTMLAGGMCSFVCTLNGMMVGCCNMTMCMCKCDMTDKGVCLTCTSGDPKCCDMIQACCDYLTMMCKAGCTCCCMMNGTPVCCGC